MTDIRRHDWPVATLLAGVRAQARSLDEAAAALQALHPVNDCTPDPADERELLAVLRRELSVRLPPPLARALPTPLELKAVTGGISYTEMGSALSAQAEELDALDRAAAGAGAGPALRRVMKLRRRLRMTLDLDKLREGLALCERAVTDEHTARSARNASAQLARQDLAPALEAAQAARAAVERLERLDEGQRYGIAQTRLRPVLGAVLALAEDVVAADGSVRDWAALTRLADLAGRPVFLRQAEWHQPRIAEADATATRQPLLELFLIQEVNRDLLSAPAGAYGVLLRSRQGIVMQRSFGSLDAAAEAFDAALAMDPDSEDWPELEELDTQLGAWREHLAVHLDELPQDRPEVLQRRLYAVKVSAPNLSLLNRMRALEDLAPLAEGEPAFELRLAELTLAGNPATPGGCARDERAPSWSYTGGAADTMAKLTAMLGDGNWRQVTPAVLEAEPPAELAVAV